MTGAAGGTTQAANVDVTNRASAERLAAAAVQAFGGIDVLVNNAATHAGLERKGFVEIDEAVWDRVMAMNVNGPWSMARAVAPHMRKSGQGAIITGQTIVIDVGRQFL